MNAVIYARYSAGPRQTEQSIEGQLRVCSDFCKQRGLTVVGTYCDRHISGKTDQRPEFQKLIADAKKKKFEAVVVYKTDRFARNKYDSAIYKRELKQNGTKSFTQRKLFLTALKALSLRALWKVLPNITLRNSHQKIQRGMTESAMKMQKHRWYPAFSAYYTDQDKHFQIDPEGAQIVQIIFDMYIKGEPNTAIADFLNSHGFRTIQGRDFNKNIITRIIQNRKYIGEYRYGDIVIEGGMPAIITPEVFCLAQAETERRRTRKKPMSPKAEYLLSSRLFCGHCKKPMQGISGTGQNGNKWYYYYCSNRRTRIKTCDKKQVPRDKLEKLVVDMTVNYILKEEVLSDLSKKIYAAQERQNDTDEQIAFYEKKLNDNKKAVTNILKAIESGVIRKPYLKGYNNLKTSKLLFKA